MVGQLGQLEGEWRGLVAVNEISRVVRRCIHRHNQHTVNAE